MSDVFEGRIGIVQRLLARYRVPVFDTLAARCTGGLSVFAGEEDPGEMLNVADRLEVADLRRARNQRLLGGPVAVYRQHGLREWLDEWDPDVLIVEANPRLISSRQAVRWMHARERPVLGWGWGLITQRSGLARARGAWRRRFPRMFDGMIAYSRHAAEGYRGLGFPEDRVFVAPNAAAFRPPAPPRRPPGFDGAPVVLSVGRIVAAKRLDDLLEAAAQVARERPELAPEVRIVGRGQALEGLRETARRVYPDTRFLGALYDDELAAEFDRADVFALPGQVGLAVQQAMAHGVPVIAGEGDHTQDELVTAGTGWLLPGAGPAALAAALTEALSDVPRLRAMGQAAFERVDREFNIEAMVDAFIAAATRMARSRRSAGAG